jgi:hypothetical protein
MLLSHPSGHRNPHPEWERPWPRRGCCEPPALIKVPIASKLAPTTVVAPGLREPGEATIAADRSSTRRRAQPSAAVGVRRPLPQNPGSGSGGRSGAAPVGAALAATGLLPSAGSDPGCRRGQRPPPTEPRLRLRRPIRRSPCGSGLGRDRAAAVRRLRYKPPSGSEDPVRAPASDRAHSCGSGLPTATGL